jgi:hypothetical protein
VRFFGDSIAIAYGAESRIRKAEDGKEARRSQVWTDTWLKRNGQWQIVAAQIRLSPVPKLINQRSEALSEYLKQLRCRLMHDPAIGEMAGEKNRLERSRECA